MYDRITAPLRSILLFCVWCALSLAAVDAQTIPVDLVLGDQFGNEVKLGALAATGPRLIAYSGERDAGTYLEAWANELRTASTAAGGPGLVVAANLSAVPFFVPKGAIVKQLAADYPALPILLDWKGVLAKPLGIGKDKVLVVALKNGAVAGSSRLPASAAEARRLLELLR